MSKKNTNKQPDKNLCSFCGRNPIDREKTNCCQSCIEEMLNDLEDDTEIFDC